MFLDCVVDENFIPVFNDMPDEVRKYLLMKGPMPDNYRVYNGTMDKLMTIPEYLGEEMPC